MCEDGSHYSPVARLRFLAQALVMDRNYCAFRHLSRRRPVNDFTKTLLVGLPGRLKYSFMPFSYAQRSSAFEVNSGTLSTRMVLWTPRIDEIGAIALTTCSPLIPRSASIASALRVKT